nr:MAG TPA: hypothetical protein [Caudoviricetes sp.]
MILFVFSCIALYLYGLATVYRKGKLHYYRIIAVLFFCSSLVPRLDECFDTLTAFVFPV